MNRVQMMPVATGFDPTNGAIEYGRAYGPVEMVSARRTLPSGWWLLPGAILGLGFWAALIAIVLSVFN